jgi:hypothetical protein
MFVIHPVKSAYVLGGRPAAGGRERLKIQVMLLRREE